ncbi:hypothetical protein QAD02_019933 [Eretmocerus hayati]|uniref:Uncharacterized protein n=1 Tax=Eretmocerus hayati TaxID=131215 RepID=A0ACC2PL04_9HYME|nr:hypothetical protein QAD02_019933 [Eretmocerus hayati]
MTMSQTESGSPTATPAKVGNTSNLIRNQKQKHDQVTKRDYNKFEEFDRSDRAPYRMYLQNTDNSQERINPLLINKFLIEKFQNKDVFDECYPLAKNEVCIVAKSLKTANEVLKLAEWGATDGSEQIYIYSEPSNDSPRNN